MPHKKVDPILVKEVMKLKASGLTYAQIGKKFSFTRQRAQQIYAGSERVGPGRCENCGIPKKALSRHHEDHASPHEETWLCVSCHSKREAAIRKKKRIDAFLEKVGSQKFLTPRVASKLTGETLVFCCRELVLRVPHSLSHSGKIPWHLFNWDLPNGSLAEIWGPSYHTVANFRSEHEISKAKWNLSSSYKVGLEQTIVAEKSKAKAHFGG